MAGKSAAEAAEALDAFTERGLVTALSALPFYSRNEISDRAPGRRLRYHARRLGLRPLTRGTRLFDGPPILLVAGALV